MITQWSVLSLLKQLTDIGEEEEKLCLGIALSSLERVNSRLKADADRDDVRIAQAAAGLAYYALCVRRAGNSDGVESFKAGAAERRRLFLLRGGDMNLSAEFEKWGRTLVIENTDSTQTAPFKCFIQPLRYKNKMYLYGVNTEIGYNSQGYYLYIGPPEHDLTLNEDTLIIDGDIKYQIDRAEKIKFGEEVLYVWAVVRTVVEITE